MKQSQSKTFDTAPVQMMTTGKESVMALKEGWLTKQGNYIKNWRPRWCQVRDGMLVYYKEPHVEVEPTNYFLLAGSRVSAYEKVGPGGFELIMANGEKRYMQASSKAERDDWIRCLDEASIRRRPLSKISSAESTRALVEETRLLGLKPNQRITPDDFTFLKVLGKGNYGKVMMATVNGGDGRLLAVKIIKKTSLVDEESLEHVLSENRVLQSLDHPFLVKLYCSFQTTDRLYFIMEYINGGELFFHIGREKRFSEDRVRFYASQILLAIQYLHSKGIVYRDLKLENLLIDQDGFCKITDFGLVKEGIGQNDTTSTFCGTPEYLAPEILEDESYGKSVDWWALGIVMYELMVGRPPFGPAGNMEKLFYNILNQPIPIPSSLSIAGRSILTDLLERDCTKRLGCGESDGEQVKAHAFFFGVDWAKMQKRQVIPPFKPTINDASDTDNFDKEFTQMPAVLTPMTSNDPTTHLATMNGMTSSQHLNDFSFVADASILQNSSKVG